MHDEKTRPVKVSGSQRLAFLDWIRGLAALSVVAQHAAEKIWPAFAAFSHQYFNFGKFGVAVFFLTSGFVIPLTLEKGKSLRTFWINRFFRLYPLYWLSLILVLSLFAFGFQGALTPEFQSSLARNSLMNLTMFQEFIRVPHAIGLYYTLTLELVFYLMFSALYKLDLHRRTALHAWVAIAAQALVTVMLPMMLHRRLPMAEVFFFTSFFIGTAIYRHGKGALSGRTLAALVATLAMVTAAGSQLNYEVYRKANPEEQFTFIAAFSPWVIAYGLFIVSFLRRDLSYPKAFTWLGEISYSMYLLHPVLLILAVFAPNPLAAFLFIVAGTLICSHFTFQLFEKPLIAIGKRIAHAAPAAVGQASRLAKSALQ